MLLQESRELLQRLQRDLHNHGISVVADYFGMTIKDIHCVKANALLIGNISIVFLDKRIIRIYKNLRVRRILATE